jgi:uncharacterized membrane protein
MGKGRIEAFSDGVVAIIITIMVLELKVPHAETIDSFLPLLPVFLAYVLSFTNVGIYWNNHHHMFHMVEHVDGLVLWANLHLLFWLSLMPFTTGWMAENHFATIPIAAYGVVLIMCAAAYELLVLALTRRGGNARFAAAMGKDWKGKLSLAIYLAAILLAFLDRWIGIALYVLVAVIWFVPDRRVERQFDKAPRT